LSASKKGEERKLGVNPGPKSLPETLAQPGFPLTFLERTAIEDCIDGTEDEMGVKPGRGMK
jgi:hypothetical protein